MKVENTQKRKYFVIGMMVVIIAIVFLFLLSCTRNRFTVQFEVDGKVLSSSNLKKGETVEFPKEPKKEGYTFAGWYVDGKEFDFSEPIEENKELEAKWKVNTFTVRLISGVSASTEEKVEYGKTLEEKVLEQDGYEFLGWYLNDVKYDFNTPVTSDMTLVAKWKTLSAKESTYLVEHYLMNRDGTYEETPYEVQVFKDKVHKTVQPETLSYVGYTSPNKQSTKVKEDGSTIISYYYSINTYHLNVTGDQGFEQVIGTGDYYYEDLVQIAYVLKPGYHLVSTNVSLDDMVYQMENHDETIHLSSMPNRDTPYKVEHYQMDMFGKYSETPFEIEELMGTTDSHVIPKVKDYTGYISPSMEDVIVAGDGSTTLKYYYPRKKYSVRVHLGKGMKEVTGTGEYYFGSTVTLKAIMKDGYTFDSWSTGEKEDTIKIEVPTDSVEVSVYAAANEYSIDYIDTFGTENKETYTVEDVFTLQKPKKNGYDFKDWTIKNLIDGNTYHTNTGKIENLYGDLLITANYTPRNDTSYTIEHYLMGIDGEYKESYETTKGIGTTETVARTIPKTYVGFELDEEKTKDQSDVLIDGNENSVVKVYYKRKKYTLNVSYKNILDETDQEGVESISSPNEYYYEMEVPVSIHLKDGFELEKWSNGDTKLNTTYIMTADENQSLIANIKRTSYAVTFDSKQGSNVDSQNVLFGKKITKPTEPTRAGYTFDGWYYNNGEEEKKWDFEHDTMPAHSITLIAHWNIHKNTVVFDANGGLFQNGKNELEVLNQEQGSPIETLEETPTKTGYTFDGWYQEEKEWNFEMDNMPDGALRLQAHWKANTYTIRFDGNTKTSGSMDDITCTYDEDCELTKNLFEKSYTVTYNENKNLLQTSLQTQTVKYNFKDWKNGEETYSDGKKVKNLTSIDKETITLKAEWEVDETTTELESVTRTGYQFDGWYKDSVKVDSLNDISENLNLTAHWNANHYTVKYDSNKGNGSSIPLGSVEVTNHQYDEKTKLSESEFSRDGYTFLGWSKTKHEDSVDTCNDCIEEADNLTEDNNGEVTVYAVWKANHYTIQYNGNGNTNTDVTMATTSCTYDEDCKLSDNVFEKKYTVTYDNNDKSNAIEESQTVTYHFEKWQLNENKYDDESNVKNLTTEKDGTVTLNVEWKIDEDTTTLKKVERTGYDFDGWYDDEQKMNDLKSISKDLNLQAHWKPITYTIIFDGNGGTSNGKSQVRVIATYDQETDALNSFTKSYQLTYNYDNGTNNKIVTENADFNNWKLKDSNTTYSANSKIGNLTSTKDAEVTLVAQWKDVIVNIEEKNPTKENVTDDHYYTYEFKDWIDGAKEYHNNDTITLNADVTLNAEYLKVIDSDKYIEEKIITTGGREDIQVTKGENHSYTIDIVDVTDAIVDENDIQKIDDILQSEDVQNVILTSGNNNVSITEQDDTQKKVDEFLAKVTESTSDKVETEKKISSLFKKSLSITVNLDEELAKTKDNGTSVSYNLNYTNKNGNIITKETIKGLLDKTQNTIDKNKKYIIKGNDSDKTKFSITYKDPTAKLLYLQGLSAQGELSGAGIKTAFWNLLGNPKQASSYPATFIKSMDVILTSKSGEEVTVSITPNNVSDDGKSFLSEWKLFGLSLMTDLEKAFGMSTNNITNATLTELSTVNPFRVRFHVEDGKALEDPYSLEYSFDFIQA